METRRLAASRREQFSEVQRRPGSVGRNLRYAEDDGRESPAGEIGLDHRGRIAIDVGVCPRAPVVDDAGDAHLARAEGLKRHQRVVERAETSAGDEDDGPALSRGEVDRKGVVGERNVETACGFHESDGVMRGTGADRLRDAHEIDRPPFAFGGEFRGRGEGEDLGRGEAEGVLFIAPAPADAAMGVDVLGKAVVPGLNHLDGDRIRPVSQQGASDQSRHHRLADAGVDPGDKISRIHDCAYYSTVISGSRADFDRKYL